MTHPSANGTYWSAYLRSRICSRSKKSTIRQHTRLAREFPHFARHSQHIVAWNNNRAQVPGPMSSCLAAHSLHRRQNGSTTKQRILHSNAATMCRQSELQHDGAIFVGIMSNSCESVEVMGAWKRTCFNKLLNNLV